MRKHLGFLLALIGGVAVAALASPGSAAAETVRIAHSTWVGYGPGHATGCRATRRRAACC